LTLLRTLKFVLAALPAAISFTIPSSARADTFNFVPSTCVVTGTGSCDVSQQNPVGGDAGGNWVAAFTSGNVSPTNGQQTAGIAASGSATGSLSPGELIPVSWDFIVDNNGSTGNGVNWQVIFNVDSAHGSISQFAASGTALWGTEVTGSGNINSIFNDVVSSFSFSLSMSGADSNYTFDVPTAATLDLNPQAQSSGTPEPASLLLVGSGIGILLFRRKTRSA
jgi:hypothetical protein